MPLQRLLYTSRIVEQDPALGATIAREIAHASAARNAACGLTGSLVFIDGAFIQVIEGEQAQIEATFERICCDLRHQELKLLDLQDVSQRLFDGWDMACLVDDKEPGVVRRRDLTEVRILATLNAHQAMLEVRRLLDAEPHQGRLAA